MAYITGTVTDANPGPALYALMAPALTTAGFTLVDTVAISTRTHKVWKSAAANNTQGLDWYLDIAYTTTGAGTLWVTPFEYYDPATDLGYRGPYNTNNTTIETTYYTRYGATGFALETNWTSVALGVNGGLSLTTAAFGYWISVTGNRVVVLGSTEPSFMLYAGMYTPDSLYAAKAGAALYPLVYAKLLAGSLYIADSSAVNAPASPTRFPPAPTVNWAATFQMFPATPGLVNTPAIPNVSATYPAVVWPIDIYASTGGAAHPARYGALIDTAVCSAAATVARGDTLTISSVLWTLGTYANNRALLIKQV